MTPFFAWCNASSERLEAVAVGANFFTSAHCSGITEYGLDLCQVGGDPLRVDRAPVADGVMPGVVALARLLDEDAVDIQVGEGGEGVLGGAPGHAGGGHQRRHAAGGAAVDQPPHIEAAVETGFGLADIHR